MKYVIFGCLLILTGFAALNHDSPSDSISGIELPIQNARFYQQSKIYPNVDLTQSYQPKPLTKFISERHATPDTMFIVDQSLNEGG
jgi:hypothetical protein